MFEELIDPSRRTLKCGGRRLILDRPRIMAVVNVTPDSFSDGGQHFDAGVAIAHGLAQAAAGADLLDVGGESTRPGADPVPVAEELRRVIPVIQALAEQTSCVISVDTSKPEVMRAAVAAGAGMVNDVRALAAEGALHTVAGLDAALCLMHMQGEPGTMQEQPHYEDVIGQVHRFLADRILACALAGIERSRIVIDPGLTALKPNQIISEQEYLDRAYRLPDPRMTLGPALVGLASACLDVSDGLVRDGDRVAPCRVGGLGGAQDE